MHASNMTGIIDRMTENGRCIGSIRSGPPGVAETDPGGRGCGQKYHNTSYVEQLSV